MKERIKGKKDSSPKIANQQTELGSVKSRPGCRS